MTTSQQYYYWLHHVAHCLVDSNINSNLLLKYYPNLRKIRRVLTEKRSDIYSKMTCATYTLYATYTN